jgi:hypothetical protein
VAVRRRTACGTHNQQNNGGSVRTLNNDSKLDMSFNTVRIKIFNYFQVALLDTGCGTSVVSERLVRKLRLPITPIRDGESSVLFGASGHTIHVLGRTEISLKLGGLTVPFNFLVVQPLTQDLILGLDFLESTRAVINCSDRTVTFYDNITAINLLDNKRKIVACLTKDCELEPRSENILPVRVSRNFHHQCILLEPVAVREKQKYLVARALVTPQGYFSACKILNPTDQKIKLRKRLVVAQVQTVDVSSITSFEDDDTDNH